MNLVEIKNKMKKKWVPILAFIFTLAYAFLHYKMQTLGYSGMVGNPQGFILVGVFKVFCLLGCILCWLKTINDRW